MTRYADTIYKDAAQTIVYPGVQVVVRDAATLALAAITDASGVGISGSAVTSDSLGLFTFNADPGTYLLQFVVSGAIKREREIVIGQNGPLYLTDYGASPGSAASDVLTAIKALVAATPTGGLCIIPEGTWTVDVTGGLSNAVLIDRPMTIQLDGRLQTNAHTVQTNPLYPFKVTADDVSFEGTGTIAGDGSVNDTNSGDESTHPGLIYVTGKRFRFSPTLTIDTPPKVGICLVNATYAQIGFKWKGGPTVYGSTAYFGALAAGGGNHTFADISAPADPVTGAKVVNMIFTGGTAGNANNCTLRDSYIDAWEKCFYGHGFGHHVHHVRGTGVQTDYVRLWGDNCIASHIVCDGAAGGVTILDGAGCWVHHCAFTGCTQTGVNVQRNSVSYSGGFSNTRIEDNYLRGAGGAQTYGIQFITDGASSTGIRIRGNDIANFGVSPGQALIRFEATSPYTNNNFEISHNQLNSTTNNGILVTRAADGRVHNHRGGTLGAYFAVESGSSNIAYEFNASQSSGISGASATSMKRGNRFSTGPNRGVATLVAGTVTVSTTEVMAGDTIVLSRQTTGGTAGHLSVGTITAGASFVINSTSATETSTVAWSIEH